MTSYYQTDDFAEGQRMADRSDPGYTRCKGCGAECHERELSTYGNCVVCVQEIADMARDRLRDERAERGS